MSDSERFHLVISGRVMKKYPTRGQCLTWATMNGYVGSNYRLGKFLLGDVKIIDTELDRCIGGKTD